jgi:hypothetical protein
MAEGGMPQVGSLSCEEMHSVEALAMSANQLLHCLSFSCGFPPNEPLLEVMTDHNQHTINTASIIKVSRLSVGTLPNTA